MNNKVMIYVDFNDRSEVKTLGCFYDFVKAHWYSYVDSYHYCYGSLYYFLYPILFFNEYKDNHIVKRFGAKFNATHTKFCVFHQNKYFLNGTLDRYHPTRNGKFYN